MADDPRVTPTPPRPAAQPGGQAHDPDKARADMQAGEEKRRKAQEEANKQAADVMEKSTPWPTQEQADQAKLGSLKSDDLQAPEQPEMPPLHEQYRKRDEANKRK